MISVIVHAKDGMNFIHLFMICFGFMYNWMFSEVNGENASTHVDKFQKYKEFSD